MHLKVVRLYVESVLRYGLPANYVGIAVKVSIYLSVHLLGRISNDLLIYTKARAENHKTDAHGLATTLLLSFSALTRTRQFQGCRIYKRGLRWGVPVTARSGILRLRSVRNPLGCKLNVGLYVYRPFCYSVEFSKY